MCERFHSGTSLDKILAQLAEHSFIGEQLARLIVNQKNVDLFIHGQIYVSSRSG
jgi:hypothetical protein